MREDAHLVDAVHFLGADLVLDRRAEGADHGRVQTLVAVGLGDGDEVLEARMYGLVELVQGAEREVALLARAHDHAKAVDVENVGEGGMRVAHAVVDAVDRLVAALNLGDDAVARQRRARLAQNALKNRPAVAAG